jgi:hypothetical protein
MAVAEAAAKAKSSLASVGAAKSASQLSNSAKIVDSRL